MCWLKIKKQVTGIVLISLLISICIIIPGCMYVPVYYREFTANTLTINKDWKLDLEIRGYADISKKKNDNFDNKYFFSYYFLSKDSTKKSCNIS
jgi:hypothetical protein